MPIGTLNTSNNGSNRLVLGAKDGVNVGGSLTLDEQSQWDQLDVAVYKVTTETTTTGNSAGTVAGKLCITKDQNMEKKAIFIYIENGATLKLYGMDVGYAAQNTTATPNTNRGELKWFGEGKEDWSQYYGPDIFIYVEPGGTLSFERTNTIPVNGKNELAPY
ncbi:hypothetical protein [Eubacterium aggregans]|uniref:hypothetical protein n=1 Tax=Eubacterium aggregans TaxID=81409 RepID=UPI003F2CDEAC